jgi:hypothetical protein
VAVIAVVGAGEATNVAAVGMMHVGSARTTAAVTVVVTPERGATLPAQHAGAADVGTWKALVEVIGMSTPLATGATVVVPRVLAARAETTGGWTVEGADDSAASWLGVMIFTS